MFSPQIKHIDFLQLAKDYISHMANYTKEDWSVESKRKLVSMFKDVYEQGKKDQKLEYHFFHVDDGK